MKKIILSLFLIGSTLSPYTALAQQSPVASEELNVKNLKIDSQTSNSATLSWDAVEQAEEYRLEYGKSSVSEQGQTYTETPVSSQTTSTTIENLEPGTTYYFSVVSFSENKTKVSSKYSNEVSLTTETASQTSNFKLEEVKTVSNSEITISFSDEVALPEAPEQELTIRELNNPTNTLNVVKVEIDETDAKKLKIQTGTQTAGTEYAVEITDKIQSKNNASLNENNNSGSFKGFSEATEENEVLKVDSAKSLFIEQNYLVELDFNVGLKSGFNSDSFKIVESNDPASFLTVKEVKTNNQDDSKVLLVTDQQKEIKYTVILASIEGQNGEVPNDQTTLVEFEGQDGTSETNPDDLTQVKLENVTIEVKSNVITATWDVKDGEAEIDKVKLSLLNGTGTTSEVDYSAGKAEITYTKTTENTSVEVEAYSGGVPIDNHVFNLNISETGPAGLLALLATSGGAAGLIRRKRNSSL